MAPDAAPSRYRVAYVVRAQYRIGDAGTEGVYGPFRSYERANEFADKAQALATAAESRRGEADYGDLTVDVLHIQPASLQAFIDDYELDG